MAQTVQDDQLRLEFVLDLRHDSNVTNISQARAEALGLQQSDQIASPALQLNARKTLGLHSIRATAYAGYDFYASNSRLNNERLAAQAAADLNLRPCEFTPSIDFSRRRSEFGSLAVIGDPLATLNNTQTEQRYGISGSCGGVVGLRPEAGLSYTKGNNSALIRQTADFESVQARLGIGYRHPSIGDLSLYYSQQETRYDNRAIGGVKERYEVERIGLSARRDIGARLAWDGQVYLVNTSSVFGQDFEGVGYSVGLTLRVTPQLRARGNFGRDVQTSLNNDALYTLDKLYGVNLDYAVNSRLNLNGGYSLTKRNYTYSSFFGPLPPEVLRNETLHMVNFSATYRRSERLGFSLFSGYKKRTANGALYDYDGYFVGIGVTMALAR